MRIIVASILVVLISSVALDCGTESVANNLGICIKPTYIEGCYTYSSNEKCFQCVYNYVLGTDGKCQYQQSSKITKPCCKTHDLKTGVCQQCQHGLFLDTNGKCVDIPVIGCLTQDQKGKCIKCAKSYYLQNGECKTGVLNCAQYLSVGSIKICDQCIPGNSLINNACLPNTILGCKDQVNGVCKDCFDPFFQKDNHCQVPNCQSHNQFGCVTCQCGYFLTADRKCQQISQGCIRYNRGICTDCMQHFKLKGGVCDIQGCQKIDGIRCIQCADGYQSTELGCRLKNCLISNEGLCQVCNQGYHRKEGQCIQVTKPLISK